MSDQISNAMSTDQVSLMLKKGLKLNEEKPAQYGPDFWSTIKSNPALILNSISDQDLQNFENALLNSHMHDDDVFVSVTDHCVKQLMFLYKIKQLSKAPQYLDLLMKCISSRESLTSQMITRLITAVSPYLDRRLDRPSIVSPSVVIVSKCLLLDQECSISALQSVIDDLIIEDSLDSLIVVFSIITMTFHMDNIAGRSLFCMPQLQLQQFSTRYFLSEELVITALEALSAACVDKQSRTLLAENFDTVIKTALESPKLSVRLLAASISVKTTAGTESNNKSDDTKRMLQLSDIFEQAVAEKSEEFYGVALEGLAYTSLITDVKELIIKNKKLLTNVVQTIDKHIMEPPLIYCALSILVNLTQYSVKLTEEQQRIMELKSYASKNGSNGNEAEPDSHVASRCSKIMETGVTGIISRNCHKMTTVSKSTVASLLRNLVVEKSHRQQFTKEGGLSIAIYLLLPPDKEKLSGTNSSNPIDEKARNQAAGALAKTLISIDPSIALSSKMSTILIVPLLLEQLSNEVADMPLLDSFEALLALTNVAAVDEKCRDAIMVKGWAKLEALWTSNNRMVQRASVELICNLGMSPYCAEKFLAGTHASDSKLELLAAFTDVDDYPTQCAAAGALAVLSEWDPAAQVMSKSTKLMTKLLELLKKESDPNLIIRSVVTLHNIICGENADLDKINSLDTIEVIRKLAKSEPDEETLQMIDEMLEVFE